MKGKILVVDDSSLARRMTRRILEELGHEVEEAPDGAQALELYALNHYDAVVLDMVMHGMYGQDVLVELRKLNPKLPVIIASADIQKSTREQVKNAGAAAMVNKPVSKEELADVLATVLTGGDNMELTPSQKDALTELINIGYARAAAALSELTGHRISLEVPEVAIHLIQEIIVKLDGIMKGEIASVNQVFSGAISGNAILLLDTHAALLLNQLLTDRPNTPALDGAAREVITEVGNIVLNACLGAFGNLLKVQVTFTVPSLKIESVQNVLRSITVGDQALEYALIIHTRFHMRVKDVSGYLVIILGVTSLEKLLVELKKWEDRELS